MALVAAIGASGCGGDDVVHTQADYGPAVVYDEGRAVDQSVTADLATPPDGGDGGE